MYMWFKKTNLIQRNSKSTFMNVHVQITPLTCTSHKSLNKINEHDHVYNTCTLYITPLPLFSRVRFYL